MRNRVCVTIAALTLTGQALADNVALTGKTVRVQVGLGAGAIDGKLTTFDGCLYVNFKRPTKDGIQSVRMDQVQSLQVLEGGAWQVRSVSAVLKKEPAHCFAEANG